jgi:hypothetical protein
MCDRVRITMRFPAIIILLLSVALPLAAQDHSPERERARQEYLKISPEYNSERALQVCEERAEREKMLRSQNRIDDLDAEVIARDEEWKREDKRLKQAIEDERAAHPELEKFQYDWQDSDEVRHAKMRILMKNSPANQAFAFHYRTSDILCKAALSTVTLFQMLQSGPLVAPVPSAPSAPSVDYSFPTPAPRKPSYQTPSHTVSDIEVEMETERVRQLEKKVNDLENKNK